MARGDRREEIYRDEEDRRYSATVHAKRQKGLV